MSKLKSLDKLFEGRHFDREIILCVRWYLRYKLSLRDLVEMMVERGLYRSLITQTPSGATSDSRRLAPVHVQGDRKSLGCRSVATSRD
jgi:hypothetical protein